jgi:alcohol dehydrogenase class IV
MIVRWGLDELPGVPGGLSVRDPLLISTERWRDLDLPVARRFYGAQPHAAVTGVRAATSASDGADGLAHGTMNAVCLPPALRYNADVAAAEIARLGEAMDDGDAIARVSELGALAGPTRLRDYGVPREDLETLPEAIAARPPAKSNPRPAPAGAIRELLKEIW